MHSVNSTGKPDPGTPSRGMQPSLISWAGEGECAGPVTVYTDGGCDPNPGPGGWAALLLFPGREVVLSGNDPDSTNNRMEMEAAIAALGYLAGRYGHCQVELYTDSTYLRQGITQWIDDWFARRWKTKGGEPVKNQELWRKLYDLTHTHEVHWQWIRGHTGDPFNERVDALAGQARARLATTPGELPVPAASLVSLPSSEAPKENLPGRTDLSVGVSCRGSSGPCGWAAVLRAGAQRRVLSGREQETTGNLLLLQATIRGLEALEGPSQVTVYTDSDYLGRGAGEWVWEWQRRQWQTHSGRPVKNREQWEALLRAAQRHQVDWRVIREEPVPADLREAKETAARQAS